MTPTHIRTLRRLLGESTETFGARVGRSARTIENWEQGRRTPSKIAAAALAALDVRVLRRQARRTA